jgi:hypothetical protein
MPSQSPQPPGDDHSSHPNPENLPVSQPPKTLLGNEQTAGLGAEELTTTGRNGYLRIAVIVRRRAHPRYFPFRPAVRFPAALWEISESASVFHFDAHSVQVRICTGRCGRCRFGRSLRSPRWEACLEEPSSIQHFVGMIIAISGVSLVARK